MEIAVSCPGFSLRPPEEVAGDVAGEFSTWEVVAEALHQLPGNRRVFSDIMERYGLRLQIHAPLSDVNIGSLSPPMRGKSFSFLWETLETANDLGLDVVTVHPGHVSPLGFYDRERVFELSVEGVRMLDKINRAYDLRVALENMPPMATTICTTPRELESHLEGTDIGFCLDVGHAHASGTLKAFLSSDLLMDRLENVHAHDNGGERDEHLVVGEGTVPWEEVKRALASRGYGGTVVIESRGLAEAVESRSRLREWGW
ncbi:MAG: sugar phosphate isomerase/epimerase [Thermoplasmata archaeon]|nr:sugar phosphate isomerase/epimerase [Thermoplasmata archaeon]